MTTMNIIYFLAGMLAAQYVLPLVMSLVYQLMGKLRGGSA